MKILIIEDDVNKLNALSELIRERFPEVEADAARSLVSGVRRTREWSPDIVLLDMTLPSYDQTTIDDGGAMEPFGGVEFLRQMRRFKLSPHVFVVTQFETFGEGRSLQTREQLSHELESQFPGIFCGMLHYHASLQEWATNLVEFVTEYSKKVQNENLYN